MRVNERSPTLSVFRGILASGAILCPAYIVFFFFTFNLAGGETIQQVENQNRSFLALTVVLAVVIAFVIRRLWTKEEHNKVYGIGILSLIIFIGAVGYYVANFIPHKSFDNLSWAKQHRKPLGMAATLVEEQKLVGLNRQEVEEMLGTGDEKFGDASTARGSVSYLVEDNWKMTVYFENDKVVSSELRLPWLGV